MRSPKAKSRSPAPALVSDDHSPLPRHPNPARIALRRSLRLSSPPPQAEAQHICAEPNPSKASASLPGRVLRRSPRLLEGSPAGEDATSGVSLRALCESKKPKRICGPALSLRRSPRFSVSPAMAARMGIAGGVSTESDDADKCSAPESNTCSKTLRNNPNVARVGQLRWLQRHSNHSGQTDVDLCLISNGSNKYSSKKIKVSIQKIDSSTTWNESILIQPSEEVALIKDEKDEDFHLSFLGFETIEKQSPLENKVSDSLGRITRKEKINFFIGDPIPDEAARERWQWRYGMKKQKPKFISKSSESDDEDEIITDVKCHYRRAIVNGCIYNLGDCATIQAKQKFKGAGGKEHVGRIIEFFRTTENEDYFRVQWFYRAEDTVLQGQAGFHNNKRLFYSKVENDNPVDCILAKVKIARLTPKFGVKLHNVPQSDFYYDMEYCIEYSSFCNLQSDTSMREVISPSLLDEKPYDGNALLVPATSPFLDKKTNCANGRTELVLLDLFSGCGGMSTGLHLGAKVSSVDLLVKWSVDCDESACESLKSNHPETLVRNEAAEDFLQLLKEWEKLCKRFPVERTAGTHMVWPVYSGGAQGNGSTNDVEVPRGEYEVDRLIDICYGDPCETGKRGLKFKVRWLGYTSKDDTWEPIEGLRKCQERIADFVRIGYQSKILPLPGDVDVICGGPPCQGISGYNRYRNVDSPLDDERNRQILVFMDIVQFLKPKFVLMENVTDILRFDDASLGRYALSSLVHMGYQARLGTIAAGSYGLPQFRLRVFLWGAHPDEMLPQFPLPTHDVIVRYWPPLEFERNTVAYYEGQSRELEKAAVLRDVISDLPEVTNHESREDMPYDKPPETELQRFIRSSKYEMTGCSVDKYTQTKSFLYDHRPYMHSEDNYLRICQIPKRKGANFRDFPGVIVGDDNVARRDNTKPPILLPSGKLLVPDFCFTYEQGKSKRPFGRLWWDETVPTVLTQPNFRNQILLHPEQDRVLTIRECARLQGFPDYYRFCGTLKERYRQIGNAVAIPVARALGFSLGMAFRRLSGTEPNMILPPKFSYSSCCQLANSHSSVEEPEQPTKHTPQ